MREISEFIESLDLETLNHNFFKWIIKLLWYLLIDFVGYLA